MNLVEIKEKNKQDLILGNNVTNTEAKMSLYKRNINNKKWCLLKEYYNLDGKYFSNKMLTIHQLIFNKEEIHSFVPNLILPNYLASRKNTVVGYTMDYHPSVNLHSVLSSYDFTVEEKLAYLKEVGEVFENLKQMRDKSSVTDMYLNDVHEDNFIIDEKGKLFAVDVDSCKITNNEPFAAKYLIGSLPALRSAPKKFNGDENEFGIIYKPTEETDLHCYLIMILNFLYNDRSVQKMTMEEYYEYMEYLDSLGLSNEVLSIFLDMYTSKPNINPKEVLDALKEVYPRSTKNVYNCVRKRK
ncbi:MAG: hypothetical protein R3Y13_02590 [bacterium]